MHSLRSLWVLPLLLGACSDYNLWEDQDPNVDEDDTGEPIDPNAPQPNIKVEPQDLSFGWRLVDCPSDAQTVTVTNIGDQELVVDDLRLAGTGADRFTLNGVTKNLAPGESFEVDVTFTAAALTDYTVKVEVESNDPDTPVAKVNVMGSGAETTTNEQIFVQPDVGAVDVLWVVDNSGSMSDIVEHLGDRFERSLDSFSTLGIDYQIAVVSTDMDTVGHQGLFQGADKIITNSDADPRAAFAAATDLGAAGSGSERGMDAAYAAMTAPLVDGPNSGLIREDAAFAVVVISDEDDSSNMSDSQFINWLNGFKTDPSKTSLSAVVGDEGGFFGCQSSGFPPVSATSGTRYIKAQKATGGTFQSICDDDFDQLLSYLAYGASGLLFEFPLDKEPRSLAGIKVEVDGVEVPRNFARGWIYDSANNSVRFARDVVPGPNAVVVISYPVDEDC
ncbi:MAG: choice-of-anchor D domain-containing protein [Myxococcota bacterium]